MDSEKIVHYTLLQEALQEALNSEPKDDFLTELRTMLNVDDIRTIRFALEEYYNKLEEDRMPEGTKLEDIDGLRAEEDHYTHMKLLASIAEVHWKIRYAANKNGVDC